MNAFDLSQYQFNVYGLPHAIVGTLSLAMGGVILFREGLTRATLAFCAITVMIALWLVPYLPSMSAQTSEAALFWVRLMHFPVVFFPLALTYLYGAIASRDLFRYLAASFLLSSFFYLIILTTNWKISGVYHSEWGYHAKYAPGSAVFLLYFFGTVIYDLYLMWRNYKSEREYVRRRRAKELMIAFTLGCLGSVDYLPGLGIEVFPFGFVFAVIFLVLITRVMLLYRLVDITPDRGPITKRAGRKSRGKKNLGNGRGLHRRGAIPADLLHGFHQRRGL